MEILRILIMLIFTLFVSIPLGKNIIIALKTGTIRHTDTTSKCSKDKNPVKFWSLVILNFGFMTIMIFGLISMIFKYYG